MSQTERVKRGREALDGVRKAATYVRDVVRKIPATQGLPIWTEEMTLQSFIDELQRSNDASYGPLNVLLKRVKSNAAKYIEVKEQDNGYKGLFFRKPAIPAPRTDYDQFGCVNVGFYGGLLTIKDDADMESAYLMPTETKAPPMKMYIDAQKLTGTEDKYAFYRDSARELGSAHLVNHRCITPNGTFVATVLPDCRLIVAVLSIHRSFFTGLKQNEEITVDYGPKYVQSRGKWLEAYNEENGGRLTPMKIDKYDTEELRECICEDCIKDYPPHEEVTPERRMQRKCMLKLGRDH